MNVLLVSTYELGRQPINVASPAAALRADGRDVIAIDTSVEDLSDDHIDKADAVAISVPMHTATRLAIIVANRVKSRRPEVPVALYGLYAGVPFDGAAGNVDAVFEGEFEPGLTAWVSSVVEGAAVTTASRHTGRSVFEVPDRSVLPELESYARLEYDGTAYVAAAVEASHGCRHRCRHCPIPAVYDGRIRIVPTEVVLADIDQLVAGGAQHVTFGDADFLNAPRHSLDTLRAAHEAHPDLTFDATIKVEHILQHRGLWPELAELNLLFVVSAFESVDEETLAILDKGHTVADMAEAVAVVRGAGVHMRPTWLPFLPWTTPGHIVGMFRFIEHQDLLAATDPVQMSIRLLIPRGSLLEDHPRVTPHLDRYDVSTLTWIWQFEDGATADIHGELASIAAKGSDCGQDLEVTLGQMWAAVDRLSGGLGPVPEVKGEVPRLTESWFCCAEPTEAQFVTIGSGPR